MAQLLPDVVFRLLDSSANPISGGTATFYLSGTSTLTPIYSDSDLETALPNPISTNSGGLFINGANAVTAIYTDDAIAYRAVFKDASGTTIRDIDPVFPSSSTPYGTRTQMTALYVAASQLTVNTTGYSTAGVGGAEYVRTSLATITSGAYPAASYFRSLDRYMPDGSIDATNGGYWLLSERVPDFYMLGAVGDGTTNDAAAVTATLQYASKFTPVLPAFAPAGKFGILTTVSFQITGQALIGSGSEQSQFIPLMTDGTSCPKVPAGITTWKARGFSVLGTVDITTFRAGTSTAQNCVAFEAWSTVAPYVTRFDMRDIRTRGCAKGFRIGGFSGDQEGLRTSYCDLGYEGTLLNDTLLGLRTEACRQDLVITDSDGLHINRLSCQGSVANELAATIDDCKGLVMSAPYWESEISWGRATSFLVVGGTTEVVDLDVTGARVAASSGFAAGVYPITLNRVNGGRFEGSLADGSQGCGILTTAGNTKNFDVFIVPENAFNRDESGIMDAAINYFPNSQFEAGLKGWRELSPVRATISLETTGVRRGKYAVKVLATAGQVGNYCQWSLPANLATALRGKTMRLMVCLTVPNMAAYDLATRTAFPQIQLQSYNGAVTTTSADVSAKIIDNATTMAWVDLTIQSDATFIYVNVFANNSNNVAAGTEYVIAQSISIVDARVDLQRQFLGEYWDSDLLPRFNGERLQYWDTATPTDADMSYIVGDIIWNSAVAAGGSPGWVCTTAGVGGTAVFKAMAAVAA